MRGVVNEGFYCTVVNILINWRVVYRSALDTNFLYQINDKLGSAIGHQVATHVNPWPLIGRER